MLMGGTYPITTRSGRDNGWRCLSVSTTGAIDPGAKRAPYQRAQEGPTSEGTQVPVHQEVADCQWWEVG
jgi:hypothetical protein